jgi:hypothetical protein
VFRRSIATLGSSCILITISVTCAVTNQGWPAFILIGEMQFLHATKQACNTKRYKIF